MNEQKAVSEAQKRAHRKYMEKFVEIKVRVTPEKRTTIQEHAQVFGESATTFINRAIDSQMERDGVGGPQEAAETPTGDRVSLPSGTLKAAQEAAQAVGEALPVFLSRAVSEAAERDRLSRDS